MWWEFKVLITAGLFLLLTAAMRTSLTDHQVAKDTRIKNAQIIAGYVILAVVLRFIWLPTGYTINKDLQIEKVEK